MGHIRGHDGVAAAHRALRDGHINDVVVAGQNASAQIHVRSTKEITRFFDGFEVIEPGVVWTAGWRPDPGTRPAGRPDSLHGGVGRKPAP